MMAAAQPFISGAISKTVNMPEDTTVENIADAYRWGGELGLKALAIYRDGSKRSQPLSTKAEGDSKAEAKSGTGTKKVTARPRRDRLPDTRQSLTHKFNVSGHEGYITVGLYADGRPGELFITMAKEGSTVGGLMDAFGTAISMSLQYGVPLQVLVDKFSHTRFDPMGHTTNPNIRMAKSVVDYIFRWLGMTFLSEEEKSWRGLSRNESNPSGELPGNSASGTARVAPTIRPAPTGRPDANGKAVTAEGQGANGHARGEELELVLKVDQDGSTTSVPERQP